ncbi:McrC family protein [Streptomyces althioticus]|jgi:5-methylcytosine-specific restriction enzyme subunit McrC|uniref:McrC family protein n=1 Tax=Streptomyces althioticus TaxID=83380 RepID=UPI000526909B|nr:PE-PGRS family protein [Actinospica acidiphila]WTC22021.1 McrC family protein [Streptomyces althioticus]
MSDRPVIRIAEYRTVPLTRDQLTPRDVDRLQALQAHGCVTLSADHSGWRLRAESAVGVLVLDRLRLVIEPKFAIPGERLMSWLGYALDAPRPLRSSARRWATEPDGYAELVAAALLEQCEHLVRDGLRRDYVRREAVEPVLRGRLDVAAQALRRYGQLDRLHVRTFDRETDIRDNRVLGTALRAALPLTTHPGLAHDLRGVAEAFPTAASPTAALDALDGIRYTRLNARYRAAHTWARLILRGGGVSDLLTDRGTAADGLLLRMPALWEAVVRRLAAEAAARHGGRVLTNSGGAGITVRGDLGNASVFRPDVLLELPGRNGSARSLLPVDAKYKRYDRHGVSAADVHQLLTYADGYRSSGPANAVLVHPQHGGRACRSLEVGGPRGPLATLHVIGIDTATPPEQAVAWIENTLL